MSARHTGKERLKIGVMFAHSGPMGGYGRHGKQAVALAVDQINSQGGICGVPLEFYFEDTQLDARRVRDNADKFINEYRVDFLVGPTMSSSASVLSEIAEKNGIPLILTQAASDTLTGSEFNRYVFSTVSNAIMHARAGAYLAAEMLYREWMVIAPDYSYGHSSWVHFSEKLCELRPDVVIEGELFVPFMTHDYTGVVKKVLSTAPDAVWAPLWGNDAVLFILQALNSDPDFFRKFTFVFPCCGALEVLGPVGHDMPNGILMSSRYYFSHPDVAVNNSFVQAYSRRFGEYPDYMAAEAFSGIYFLRATAQRAQSTDTEKIIDAVELEPLAWDTPEGWKIMRPEDHLVIENVVWGETKMGYGNTRAHLLKLQTIQAEQIIRTEEELEFIGREVGEDVFV